LLTSFLEQESFSETNHAHLRNDEKHPGMCGDHTVLYTTP